MKNLSLLFALMFVVTFAFAQGEEEEPQMFGSKRDIKTQNYKLKDFGTIKSNETVEHTFKIKNNSENELNVISAEASEGVTVTLTPQTLKAKSEGTYKVQVNASQVDRGNFALKVVIKCEQTEADGSKTPKDITYTLKGKVVSAQ